MSLLREAEICLANQAALKRLNAFISTPSRSAVLEGARRADALPGRGPVGGRLIAIKDNICTKLLPTTCASSNLKRFTSPYDATVVSKLCDAGAVIAGKTNLDEFGMGSHSINSAFEAVLQGSKDPTVGSSEDKSAGGSSGGSAVAVSTGQCWAALGTDTGGSVRLPAAYTGVVGFKPTYGLISRWGVIAYANSLDTVGILSRDIETARHLWDTLNVHDAQDPTILSSETRSMLSAASKSNLKSRSIRVGIPVEYNITELSNSLQTSWLTTLTSLREHVLRSLKHDIEFCSVSLPSTHQALSAYYVLAPAEASSNLAKYDGVRYGSRANDATSDAPSGSVLFSNTRGEGFGEEVKRRILLGTYSLSASAMDNYFIQAQKVRRVVQRDFDRVFRANNPLLLESEAGNVEDEGVDVLIHPTAPTLAPRLEDVLKQSPLERYVNDVFTVPASLAGLPAVSVPVPCMAPEDGLACGMQVVGQFGQDEMVLDVAQLIEDAMKEKTISRPH